MGLALTFNTLRMANIIRLPLFKNKLGGAAHSKPDGSDWSLSEWMNAVAGETGEACNVAKKLQRGDFGEPGTATYAAGLRDLVEELADVVTYCDIAAFRAGGDLGQAVRDKFNKVSDRISVPVCISGNTVVNLQPKNMGAYPTEGEIIDLQPGELACNGALRANLEGASTTRD